jgi:hypothetical protein
VQKAIFYKLFQMLKTIKLSILGGRINNLESVRRYLGLKDEKQYGFEFVYDEISPEYIIATELIYYYKDLFHSFNKMRRINPNAISIFRTGECISPDLNIFDYAVVFDRNLTDRDRVCRIPFYRYFSASLLVNQKDIDYRNLLEKKSRFCNFLYSNANAHPTRDRLFFKISEYKRVDALGNHLNNTGATPKTNALWDSSDWRRESIDLRSSYKFSIASENATFPGYVSEKLVSCLQSATVPIYWGDPTVAMDFNPDALINCHNYKSFDDVVDRVKEIDEKDELWYDIARAPWQTEEQIHRMEEDDKKYIEFLVNLFGQELKDARRVGVGYHPGRYREWFQNRFDGMFDMSFAGKLKRRLNRALSK